ncbi:MAG: hypothetical protein B6242_07715 [Anaerolineaceae bacterium 4572_78]|nr:MAG: hypothetical protein B6242_07715 [Anaerolineaceae bacterium 4572_78]
MGSVMNMLGIMFLVPLFLLPAVTIGIMILMTPPTSSKRKTIPNQWLIGVSGFIAFCSTYFVLTWLVVQLVFVVIDMTNIKDNNDTLQNNVYSEMFRRTLLFPSLSDRCYTSDAYVCRTIDDIWHKFEPFKKLATWRFFMVKIIIAIVLSITSYGMNWFLSMKIWMQ